MRRWRKRIEERLEALEAGHPPPATVWTEVPHPPSIPPFEQWSSWQLSFGGFEGYSEDDTEDELPGVYL